MVYIIKNAFLLLELDLFLFCYGQNNLISNSLNAFTIHLVEATSKEAGESLNLALSPYTVWSLLSIINEGARGNTARELESILRIPIRQKDVFRKEFRIFSENVKQNGQGVQMELSNAIFAPVEQKIYPTYQKLIQQFYGVTPQSVNFKNASEATKTINLFVDTVTKHRIPNFVTSDDIQDAAFFLTSVFFFKGQWKLPFNKTATNHQIFYDEAGQRKGTVNMMYQSGFFPYTRLDDIQAHVVDLAYGENNSKMSMIVVLPYMEANIQTTLNLMRKISFGRLLQVLNEAEQMYVDDDVQVFLPKFTVKSDFNLNVVLDKMGIHDVFDSTNADLLGICRNYLYISRLIQRAEIDVNEEGTIASAAAGASVSYKTSSPKFEANRPFLYFIVHKPTTSILFAGKISNPNTIQ